MAAYLKHILCLVLALASIHGCKAVDYVVFNNVRTSAAGLRFDKDVGIDYAKQTLSSATDFIQRLFQQNTNADRKNLEKVSLIVENNDADTLGDKEDTHVVGNEIHVTTNYIEKHPGNVKEDITGVIYHELTHILQNGNGQAPKGLIEGIADFVRLKAGYAPSNWFPAGQGENWDQGHDVTARFLDYCNSIKNGFVAELNKKMKNGYNDSYFTELLGKPVNQLWSDYKAKYAN